jgi:hypothetical protein
MKHIWVVESSGGRKYRATGGSFVVRAYFTKKTAHWRLDQLALESPGLKWRVAKYERVK